MTFVEKLAIVAVADVQVMTSAVVVSSLIYLHVKGSVFVVAVFVVAAVISRAVAAAKAPGAAAVVVRAAVVAAA